MYAKQIDYSLTQKDYITQKGLFKHTNELNIVSCPVQTQDSHGLR